MVRGSPPSADCNPLVMRATMMSRYHQSYSEVSKIPVTELLFYISLIEAEDRYIEQKIEEMKRNIKK